MNKSHSIFFLIFFGIIIICGTFLRTESIIKTKVSHPLSGDAKDYYMYAYNLRHRHTYSKEVGNLEKNSTVTPDAIRPPGYPLFLSVFVDGLPTQKTLKNILMSQMVVSTLTICFAFLLFQKLLSKPFALAASLLVALSPHLIVMNIYILTETVFCFAIVLVGLSMGVFLSRPAGYPLVVVGGAVGIASLIRPSMQFFPIPLAIFLLLHYGKRKGARFALLMILGFSIVFAPWIIRNINTLGNVSDNRLMINFLHHGMYPDFRYNNNAQSYGFPYRYDPRSDDIAASVASVLKEMTRCFQSEPVVYLKWFFLKKPIAFWSWNLVQGRDVFVYKVSDSPYFHRGFCKWTYDIMHFFYTPLIWLCLLGSLLVWLPISMFDCSEEMVYTARFMSMLLIYFTAMHMIGAPFPRYSVPLRPFLYGMALFPIHLFYQHLKKIAVDKRSVGGYIFKYKC